MGKFNLTHIKFCLFVAFFLIETGIQNCCLFLSHNKNQTLQISYSSLSIFTLLLKDSHVLGRGKVEAGIFSLNNQIFGLALCLGAFLSFKINTAS
jgi:hypothetical protein